MAKLGPDEQESDTRPAQWGNPVQNIPAISGILGSRGIRALVKSCGNSLPG